jgi:hypothetical protein
MLITSMRAEILGIQMAAAATAAKIKVKSQDEK